MEATEPAEAVFRDTVQPIFKQHCLGCHGEGELFGQLDLRNRDGVVGGGSRGPAIVPGDAGASLLYRALDHSGELRMPPAGRLPDEAVAAIGEWINGGAPFAASSAVADLDWGEFEEEDLCGVSPGQQDRRAWRRGFVSPHQAGRSRTDSGALRADRRTLIRRATIDLTGLPPAPEQVEAFVTDPAGDKAAFGKVVDRLLASPRYGERWGRHWLDVTRYADTAGFSNDYERPNAWRYRDYVIRSFNNDKPYDRFVLEQVAGDELFPSDPEAVLATGFLRMGPWEHTGMSVTAVTRQQWLDDVTHSTATAFMGLTLGCAQVPRPQVRPHLPTSDYYRVQAAFATTAFAKRPLPFLPEEDSSGFAAGRKQRIEGLIAQLEEKRDRFAGISRRHLMQKFRVSRFEDVPEVSRKLDAGLTDEQMWARRIVSKHLSHHAESIKRYEPLAYSVTSGLVEGWTRRRTGGRRQLHEEARLRERQDARARGWQPRIPGRACHPRSV